MQADAPLLIPLAVRWFGTPPAARVTCLAASREHEEALRAVSARAAGAAALADAEDRLGRAAADLFRAVAGSTGMAAAPAWYDAERGFALKRAGWEVMLRGALRAAIRMDEARMSDEERVQIEDTISTFLANSVQPHAEEHARSPALFLALASLFEFRRAASERELPDRMLRAHVWLRSLRLARGAPLAQWAVLARGSLWIPDDAELCYEYLNQFWQDMAAVAPPEL